MKGFKKFRGESLKDEWGSLDEQQLRKEKKNKDKRNKRKARFKEKHQNVV